MQLFSVLTLMTAAFVAGGGIKLPKLGGRGLRLTESVKSVTETAISTYMASDSPTTIVTSTTSPTSSAILPIEDSNAVVLELSIGPNDILSNIMELSTIVVTECATSNSQGLSNVNTPSIGHASHAETSSTLTSFTFSNGALALSSRSEPVPTISTETLISTSTSTIIVSQKNVSHTSSTPCLTTSYITVTATPSTDRVEATSIKVSPFIDRPEMGSSSSVATATANANATLTLAPIANTTIISLTPLTPSATAGAANQASRVALLVGVMAFALLVV